MRSRPPHCCCCCRQCRDDLCRQATTSMVFVTAPLLAMVLQRCHLFVVVAHRFYFRFFAPAVPPSSRWSVGDYANSATLGPPARTTTLGPPVRKVQFAVRCGRGGKHSNNQTEWMSTNQNGEWTCMEPGDLSGSESTG